MHSSSVVSSCFIYKLGMLTGQRFQAELSPSFLWKFTEFRAETPPHTFEIPNCVTPPPPATSSEFQSKKPLPRNSKMPPVVWYGYFLESPNSRGQYYSLFEPKGGSYSREGDSFKYCSLEVMPYIFCFIIPLLINKK